MGVSDARANLTEVINKVRLLGQQVVLTRREKPQAVIVSPDWYERAQQVEQAHTAVLSKLNALFDDPAKRELLFQLDSDLCTWVECGDLEVSTS